MKKLLLVSSALLVFALSSLVMSCNPKTKDKVQNQTSNNEGTAIKHGGPDQAKMDSLKAAKTKAKQKN